MILGLLTFVSIMMSSFYPQVRLWKVLFGVCYLWEGIFCTAITVLLFIGVLKIWRGLKLNPSLQRNEKIMWAHLIFFGLFGLSLLADMVGYFLQMYGIGTHVVFWKTSFSVVRAISLGLTNIIIVYLCHNFTL